MQRPMLSRCCRSFLTRLLNWQRALQHEMQLLPMTMNPRGSLELEAFKCWNIRPLGRNPAHRSLSGHVRSGAYTYMRIRDTTSQHRCCNDMCYPMDWACTQNHTLNLGGLVQDELRPLHDEGEGAMRPQCPMRGLTHLVVLCVFLEGTVFSFFFFFGGGGGGGYLTVVIMKDPKEHCSPDPQPPFVGDLSDSHLEFCLALGASEALEDSFEPLRCRFRVRFRS